MGPNTFELVDVSYYDGVQLSLSRIFEYCECFGKFMAKLIALFENI